MSSLSLLPPHTHVHVPLYAAHEGVGIVASVFVQPLSPDAFLNTIPIQI